MGAEEKLLPLGGRLRRFLPPLRAKGTVLIVPGGGYEWLSPREAGPVADAFTRAGWAAAVLEYAVYTGEPLGGLPLRQLGEAAAYCKSAAPGLPLVTCGFSAGGHLAGSLGVHWRELGLPCPDAQVLCYPVVTAGPWAHRSSIEHLTAGDPAFFSLEKHVTRDTPPTFLWHTAEDREVPVQNSLLLAEALAEAEVPFALHIFPFGPHGLSLATREVAEPAKGRLPDPQAAEWFALCQTWLDSLLAKNLI